MSIPLAYVVRGGFRESVHTGRAVLVDSDGAAQTYGEVREAVLPRSALKPFQAIAALEAGLGLEGAELAIAAASHAGEDFHLAAVRSILAGAGLEEAALGCPAAGEPAAPVRFNCSGKHAAMLAACVQRGEDSSTYLDCEHPHQVRVRAAIEKMCGPIRFTTVDGCGAPAHAINLEGLARGFWGLVQAERGSLARRVAQAMREHPTYVGGTADLGSAMMAALPGLLIKGGAEGVLAGAMPGVGAFAIKIDDGSPRALGVIATRLLERAGVPVGALQPVTATPVLGGGRPVGAIEAAI